MIVARLTAAARRSLPGRLVALVSLVLAILAACGPSQGGGPAY
jgi:hypothetical protein